MPLIVCPACKAEVSSEAVACPKCGHPLKKPKQKTSGCAWIVAIFMAVILFSCMKAQIDRGNRPPPTAQEQAQSQDNLIMVSACHQAEKSVKARLKAPATAEFPGCFLGLGEYRFNIMRASREVIVRGHVDAQNSFGAKLRREFVVNLHSSTDLANPDWDKAEVVMPE
jgi:ribosomal protein L40E